MFQSSFSRLVGSARGNRWSGSACFLKLNQQTCWKYSRKSMIWVSLFFSSSISRLAGNTRGNQWSESACFSSSISRLAGITHGNQWSGSACFFKPQSTDLLEILEKINDLGLPGFESSIADLLEILKEMNDLGQPVLWKRNQPTCSNYWRKSMIWVSLFF